MRRCSLIVLAAALALQLSCSKKDPEPANISQCKQQAQAARDQAKAQRESRKATDAARSSERALHCSQLASQMLAAISSPSDADRDDCSQTDAAARQAKLFAGLADEDEKLEKLVSTWKAKAYKPARAIALKATFVSLAMAARQAQSTPPDKLPEAVRNLAEGASELAAAVSNRQRLPDGKPDWANIAKDMDACAANPPASMSMVMVLALLAGGQAELALAESQELNHDQLAKDPDSHLVYHFLRAAALSFNGLPLLAVEQAEEAGKISPSRNIKGPELVGTLNLFVALHYLQQKDVAEADKAAVRAMQAWPDNPLAVFLTGEKLAANGQYEQAAESLEKECRNTKYQWLSAKLAARAREVRDKKGEVQPLFTDKVFLGEVLLASLGQSVAQDASNWCGQLLSSVKRLGQTLLDKLPK